ncbi:hypothetical protein AB0D24_34910 [Streptomyces javensis]
MQALADSGKTLLFVSGTGVFLQRTAGAWSEDPLAREPSGADYRFGGIR